jgi:hypothetical protein
MIGDRGFVSKVKIMRIADEVRRLMNEGCSYTLDEIPEKLHTIPDGDYLKFLGEIADGEELENGDALRY